MPMDFPNLESLKNAAKVHKFREINEGETEQKYREALADHVSEADIIEAHEIRTGIGWDKWNEDHKKDYLRRMRGA